MEILLRAETDMNIREDYKSNELFEQHPTMQRLNDETENKSPENGGSSSKSPPVNKENPSSQDETQGKSSSTKIDHQDALCCEPSDDNPCDDIILIESPVFRSKCIWLTPKPASTYKYYWESIPKPISVKEIQQQTPR